MLKFFNETEKELKSLYEELSEKDLEQQDLLHYIESNELNGAGYAKIGKALKIVRKERRVIKNDIEKLEEVKRFVQKYNNKLITGDIIQTLKKLDGLEKKQSNPHYVYKVLNLEKL